MTFDTLPFPVIDGHNDLPWERRDTHGSGVDGIDSEEGSLHTDLPKLRAGGVVGQFWSVFVPADDPDPVRTTLQQIDVAHRLIERYPESLALARTAAEVRAAVDSGRIASLLGAEGGHSIGDDLAVLRDLARLGVRYMTLTHNDDTAWADSATGSHPHGGLTDRGREIVAEMERIGMLVDLSHTAPATMRDTLDVATQPVVFSHSSTIAVNDHPRNVPDDVLARLADNGGVVMITFVPKFVSAAWAGWEDAGSVGEPPLVTVSDVADHVEHAREVAGASHIGLGGDYDGTPVLPPDLRDVSRYPVLAAELRRRGWGQEDMRALAGGNVLRVLEATDGRFARTAHVR
ncbi:dipeptidase [Curtobacterium pusillum]|uniref:Membrane dipeptidase n=1 Tax=Curtobacterium pusillum TaxID=69373 RepID=A0ABX2MC39_9MICO|nr:dipeptidase [Curtobacterium pusillum]NUU15249.1 membrane dipeptidase [Curtobacterium pusillum]GLK31419.1 membrane dipeptidase [Curtobacterium pusillum]